MYARILMGALVILVCAGAATTADLPRRKPGLWEVTMNSSDPKIPPRVQQICLDAETDALLYRAGEGLLHKMCSKFDIHRNGGAVIIDSACMIGKTNATTHNVVTYSGDSAYHENIHIQYDPPMFGKSESSSTHEGRWVGACPGSMKPGDIVMNATPGMPAGMHMNLKEILKESQ